MSEINGYSLSRQWFDFVLENGRKARPIHGILYLWIVEKANRLAWAKEFQLPTDEACAACCAADRETILKAIKDLEKWGFIKIIQESKNRFTARWVSLLHPKKSDAKPEAKPEAISVGMPDALPPATPTNNKPKTIKPKKEKEEHLFKDSMYANFDHFKAKFQNTEWVNADLKYYHESFMDWSASKSSKRVDWIATVRSGMRKDQKEGKLKLSKNNASIKTREIETPWIQSAK